MGFEDIIKKSVLELNQFANFSIVNIFLGLTITLIITLIIYSIYKVTFNGVVFNNNYAITFVLLGLITSMIILTISSNVILSLGMVGALSIVRFRAAIKDPRDIAFMFWSIAVGIACGAGMYITAIVSTLFISIVLGIMTQTKYVHTTYLLIISYNMEAYTDINQVLNKLNTVLKSKSVINNEVELTLEIRKMKENTSFVDRISQIQGVKSAVIVKYTGDYSE